MGCCGGKEKEESPAKKSQTSAEAKKKPTTQAKKIEFFSKFKRIETGEPFRDFNSKTWIEDQFNTRF